MTTEEFKDLVLCGETTNVQFKQSFISQKKIADEMIAFANSRGGMILFGVEDKTGSLLGLSYDEIQATTRELGNAANEQVRPTIYIETEVVKCDGKHFLVCHIKEGINKPYKNLAGEILVKQGADKRRVTENSEILSLFQQSQKYYPDQEGVADSSIRDIDTLALDRFFEHTYQKSISEFTDTPETLLRNIHITNKLGQLTTAGALFFARHPQQFRPVDVIKAVWFVGNSPLTTQYHSSKDIEGTIPEMFEQAMMWLKSCLQSRQEGQSVNSIGKLEIPEIVLEEMLQNSCVHRDLLKPAAIRLLVFDDRIEIINPGSLAGGLTIDEIKLGNSFARNPLLANFCSKTMTYRGLGFGVPRSLKENVRIEFKNDEVGNQFTTVIWRNKHEMSKNDGSAEQFGVNEDKFGVNENKFGVNKDKFGINKNKFGVNEGEFGVNNKKLNETALKIITLIQSDPTITQVLLAKSIGISLRAVEKQIKNLREQGILVRDGSDKTGSWRVVMA